MLPFVLLIAGIVIGILLTHFGLRWYNEEYGWKETVGLIGGIVGIASLVVLGIWLMGAIGSVGWTNNAWIYEFKAQKEYIESHQSDSSLEDVSMTQLKIDMNKSLYRKQWAYQYWGILSLYPDEIMELEAIQ